MRSIKFNFSFIGLVRVKLKLNLSLRSSVDRAEGFYPLCRGFESCRGRCVIAYRLAVLFLFTVTWWFCFN